MILIFFNIYRQFPAKNVFILTFILKRLNKNINNNGSVAKKINICYDLNGIKFFKKPI